MLLESFSDEIIEMVSRFLPERTINIMDTSGTIISSTEKERIGTFHKGAEIAAATGEIVNITEETVKNYPGSKKGCNVPLVVNGTIIGVIGIFGNPEEVKTIASFVELYVEKYFPASSKEKMLKLVNNLKVALGEHIASLDWMSDKTKVNALVKLNSFTVKIGYPDKWRDYSGIQIDPEQSYWENVRRARAFESAYALSKYGKPVDRDEWGMTPQTVNAYYNPTTNEICFPAGILQAPYFNPNGDDACNYGAIGVVIGHEMTHGFDDQGRNFDQNGNMVSWWTEEDASKFKTKTQVLVEQFNNIVVLGDTHANGQYTLGENIADQGGLRVAYTAFKKTEQGKSNEQIDGFTPDQRFYLSYANVWAANITDQEILRRTKIDVHSLGKWRVNATLRNIQSFYDAFDIKSGDKMYIAPADRVIIW